MALLSLLQGKRSDNIVRNLSVTAQAVGEASRTVDLAGQLLQQFLPHRKAHSAFYTKPVAAALMAHLAVPADDPRWKSPSRTAKYRIADYSCGTGTLLTEAYQRVQQLHQSHGGNPAAIHKHMLSSSITGCDISPAAAAIAAHNLAVMHQPLHTPAPHSNIIALHYGPINNPDGNTQTERPIALGALDILEPDALAAQTPHRYAFNKPAPEPHSFEPQSQDLILLNPPFNRHPEHKDIDLNIPDASAGIAATTPEELDRITKQYNSLAKTHGAHYATGQAHTFTTIALRAVKPGGTIALLLPSTILSSMGHIKNTTPKGWNLVRHQLLEEYKDITVLSLAAYAATGSSFSQNTATADVMLIARKRLSQDPPENLIKFANLSALPRNRDEAAELAQAIRTASPPNSTLTDPRPIPLRIQGRKVGILVRSHTQPEDPWNTARVLDPDLVDATKLLRQGIVVTQEHDHPQHIIPMTTVGAIGTPGPSQWTIATIMAARDTPSPDHPPDQIFYLVSGHDSHAQRTISSAPHKPCPIHPGMEQQAHDLQQKATLLHINDAQSYNTQPTTACISATPRIACRGWTSIRMDEPRMERATALWMNTSIGLILHWDATNHNQTGLGTASKRQVVQMPTLDLNALTEHQLQALDSSYEEFADLPLLPASEAWQDPNRDHLDHTVLVEILGLDKPTIKYIHALRNRWCMEPTVTARHGSSPSFRNAMDRLAHSVESNPILSRQTQPPTPPPKTGLPSPQPPGKNLPPISSRLLRDLADAIDAGTEFPDCRKLSLTNRKHGIALALETTNGWKNTFTLKKLEDLHLALTVPNALAPSKP